MLLKISEDLLVIVQVGVSRAVSALRPYHRSNSIEEVSGIGVNTGHTLVVDKLLVVSLFDRNNTRQWPLEQMSSGAELPIV